MANAQQKSKPFPPVDHVRVKNVQGSVWENKTDRGTFHNVTFDRSFRDQDGSWKKTRGFDLDGLLALRITVDKAIDKLLELRASAKADHEAPADAELVDDGIDY